MKIAVLLLKYIDSLHSSFFDSITYCELTVYFHYLSFSDNKSMISISEMQGEKINVSLGASLYSDKDRATFDTLYHEADAAMYESKKIVGNHAIIYSDLPQARQTPL